MLETAYKILTFTRQLNFFLFMLNILSGAGSFGGNGERLQKVETHR
jgi:hypothetical protein